jgi:hypothetical protein
MDSRSGAIRAEFDVVVDNATSHESESNVQTGIAMRGVSFRPHAPATERLAGAMVTLGVLAADARDEHQLKARRFGSTEAYRLSLCNALLGAVQAQTVIADGTSAVSIGERDAAGEQLRSLGAEGDPEKLMGFLRWQALRLSSRLQAIAAREQAGPIPVTAAHAVEAVKVLLEVIGAGQSIATADLQVTPRRATRRAARSTAPR